MSADNIEKLYQNYGVLADAKENIAQHEKEYLEILSAVKGSDKEKRLASQFIAKFFTSFPSLGEQAIEAQFDLCEDKDVAIRKQAIKDLPSLCKENKEHTQRISDILAQLLQAHDTTELNVVNNSLLSVLKSDPKGALEGLFSQIHRGTENEIVRQRCIKFLASKVKQLGREVIDKEAEDYIIAESRKVLEHEKEYLEILSAVKGSDKEKRLASQFIAKFFTSFPSLGEQAIEAQFDLCEDKDVAIRKQAIKDLPSLCKENKEHTQRISDILAQLLQAHDTTELNVVNNSLLSVLKSDPKGALEGLFSQIHRGTENEIVRQRCIKFLASKVKQLGREVIDKEAEDYIIAESRKVLEDVIAEEFEYMMELLTWTRLGKTPLGRKELVALLAAQAFSETDWEPNDAECIERLLQCAAHALPLLSTTVDSSQFVEFFCGHVLRRWEELPTPADGDLDTQLELLKTFAEMAEHCGELAKPEEKIDVVYKVLLTYLPEAPTEIAAEPESDSAGASLPNLKFSHLECVLFALHALGRKAPDALGSDAARLKALRLRLQYTARLTQGYIKKLQELTQNKKGADANTEEQKIKLAALRCTSNINIIIRDLFRSPPSFKSKVQLSFAVKKTPADKEEKLPKAKEEKVMQSSNVKRHTPITFEKGSDKPVEKRQRVSDSNVKVYTPPSGKYSNKITGGGRYANSQGGRFRSNGAPFRRRNY